MRAKPKKRLGQNFLVDKRVLSRIAASCDIKDGDTVFEIGAGSGELTEFLALSAGQVLAVEVDPELMPRLRARLGGKAVAVKLINADILKLELRSCLPAGGQRIIAVGNIPYYISSPIIEKLLVEGRGVFSDIYLTVQLEFGQRVCAGPGSRVYGSLSVFSQYYSATNVLFKIKKGSFYPVPKVDSCLLRLTPRTASLLTADDEALFFRLVRTAFSQRRKMLKNTLAGLVPESGLNAFLLSRGFTPRARAEELSVTDFAALAGIFKKK